MALTRKQRESIFEFRDRHNTGKSQPDTWRDPFRKLTADELSKLKEQAEKLAKSF